MAKDQSPQNFILRGIATAAVLALFQSCTRNVSMVEAPTNINAKDTQAQPFSEPVRTEERNELQFDVSWTDSQKQEGVKILDWDGFLANPVSTVRVYLPDDVKLPATLIATANNPRIYFDMPSTIDAAGPSKKIHIQDHRRIDFSMAIFPDRDGCDETHQLRLRLVDSAGERWKDIAVNVDDQDIEHTGENYIKLDFSHDKTGIFRDPYYRKIVQQAADDWSYFIDYQHFDVTKSGEESTFVWSKNGFRNGHLASNTTSYIGFMLYAYGISSPELRSGGEGSHQGGFQKISSEYTSLRRSGGLEIEVSGNYNNLGWFLSATETEWWMSSNRYTETADLYSIAHHEIGHAIGFNSAYPKFESMKNQSAFFLFDGGSSMPISIGPQEHFDGTVDRSSLRGAFGNEHGGKVPLGRWLITKTDLLMLQRVGYSMRHMPH